MIPGQFSFFFDRASLSASSVFPVPWPFRQTVLPSISATFRRHLCPFSGPSASLPSLLSSRSGFLALIVGVRVVGTGWTLCGGVGMDGLAGAPEPSGRLGKGKVIGEEDGTNCTGRRGRWRREWGKPHWKPEKGRCDWRPLVAFSCCATLDKMLPPAAAPAWH